MDKNLVDNILGFDPADMSAFQEPAAKTYDKAVYKTNPKDSKSEDGIYRSVVKVLVNPFAPKESIVNQRSYFLKSADGNRLVRDTGTYDSPLGKGFGKLWATKDPEKQEFAKKMFDNTRSQWVLVQVMEDENKPEEVGQFRVMKLPTAIMKKLQARMNPAAGAKNQPYPVMDPVIGLQLNMEVQPGPDDPKQPERKQREISYDLCDFGSYATCIKTDGTPILTDDEIELIDTYVTAINDKQNGKTAKKREEGEKKIEEIKPQLRPIYAKVVEYVTNNLNDPDDPEKKLDLVTKCGFVPWTDEETEFVNHWLEIVTSGIDPSTISYEDFKKSEGMKLPGQTEPVVTTPVAETVEPEKEDDLPF